MGCLRDLHKGRREEVVVRFQLSRHCPAEVFGACEGENDGKKVGHGSGGMRPLRAAQSPSTYVLSAGSREGGKVFAVDMYQKVRLAFAA